MQLPWGGDTAWDKQRSGRKARHLAKTPGNEIVKTDLTEISHIPHGLGGSLVLQTCEQAQEKAERILAIYSSLQSTGPWFGRVEGTKDLLTARILKVAPIQQ